MTYYSRPLKMPTTKLEGLQNFVQMVINKLEAGDHREALLIAADLHDTLCGSANPFASITADKDTKLIDEINRKHAKEMADAMANARADGVAEGMQIERRRVANLLGVAA